jgi:hypothetical protein
MIELQRERLLGSRGTGIPDGSATFGSNGSQPLGWGTSVGTPSSAFPMAGSTTSLTPHQIAVAALQREDQHLSRFLRRLQMRDESARQPTTPTELSLINAGEASVSLTNNERLGALPLNLLAGRPATGPTVPLALSRRMLQRQGVGYVDETIDSIVSSAADRFLATVLHQTTACRDQRLKGVNMARDAARIRKRHIRRYDADADDRKRKKIYKEINQEARHLIAIEKGLAPKKTTGAAHYTGNIGTKNNSFFASAVNGQLAYKGEGAGGALHAESNDDGSAGEGVDHDDYDSVDEEEAYYRKHYASQLEKDFAIKSDEESDADKGEVDDDDKLAALKQRMVILKDIVRPLESWSFFFRGKRGLHLHQRPDTDNREHYGSNVEDENDCEGESSSSIALQRSERGDRMEIARGEAGRHETNAHNDDGIVSSANTGINERKPFETTKKP